MCFGSQRGKTHQGCLHSTSGNSDHETVWIANAASALWHAYTHTCPHAHSVALYHSPRRRAGDLRRRAGDLQALHAFTGFVFDQQTKQVFHLFIPVLLFIRLSSLCFSQAIITACQKMATTKSTKEWERGIPGERKKEKEREMGGWRKSF